MDVRVKLRDSVLNSGRIIRLFAADRKHLVMSYVPDKALEFRDSSLNLSGEIRPRAVGMVIFGRFSNSEKCRPELAGEFISGIALCTRLGCPCKTC